MKAFFIYERVDGIVFQSKIYAAPDTTLEKIIAESSENAIVSETELDVTSL